MDNPLDSLAPPSASGNPLDSLPPPQAPTTWGHYAGLAGRAVAETPMNMIYGLHDLGTMAIGNPLSHLANKHLGTHIPDEPLKTQQWSQALTDLGVPTPQTTPERYGLGISEGMMGGPLGTAGKVNMLKAALSGGTGAASMMGAADIGAPEPVQALAGLAGAAAVPAVAGVGRAIARTMPGVKQPVAPRVTPPPDMPPENAVPVSLGLKLAPEKAGGTLGKIAQSATNSAITERILSLQNAPTVNARVGEDLGLPTATPQALAQAKGAATVAHRQVAHLGIIPTDDVYRGAIGAVDEGEGTLGGPALGTIKTLKDFYASRPAFDAADAQLKIRAMRRMGFAQLRNWQDPEGQQVGSARLQIAGALEDQIDRNIATRPDVPPDLIDQFRAERVQLAKINSAQAALRGPNISVADLARQLKAKVPLSDNMRALAESYATHDRVLQDPGRVRYAGPITYGDIGLGALGHFFNPLGMAALAARPLVRAGITSDLYQKYGIQGGGGTPAAPSAAVLAAKYPAQAPIQPQAGVPLQPLGQGPLQQLAAKYAQPPEPPEPPPPAAKPPPDYSPLTTKFRQELENDYAGAKARYAALNDPKIADTKGGRVLNTDMARELSPEYAADRTLSPDVHEPASEFIKKMYAERLAMPVAPGYDNVVLGTAGGTGAGKTTAIDSIPALKTISDRAHTIYDTNMGTLKSAHAKIEQALAAGKQFHVALVDRDPVEALTEGALPRAMRMGRTVPLQDHADTHAGARETVQALQQIYANNPRVKFSIINNRLGKGNAQLTSMDSLAGTRYNVPVKELRDATDQAFRNREITPAVYQGTTGEAAPTSWGTGAGGQVSPGDRPEPGGQPEPQRQGGTDQPVVTAAGRQLNTRYELVEAPSLITSDHPQYPQALQPRQRTRLASRAQVEGIARDLNPELLGRSATADTGAPIVGPDNAVESGNGRVMGLRRAYEAFPDRAQAYKDFLGTQGFDPAGMTHPVLIRRRLTDMTPDDRAAFTKEANTPAVMQMSAAEQALSDAPKLDAATLQHLHPGELTSTQNAKFVSSFFGKLAPTEKNAFVDPDGQLSQGGIRRLQGAILARGYGGTPEAAAVLTRALESGDNDVRSITGALTDAAPAFAQLRQGIESGHIPPSLDVGDKLALAVEKTAQVRASGRSVDEYLKQQDAFTPLAPVVEGFMRAFYNQGLTRAAGREAIAKTLGLYAERAQAQRLDQGDVFGNKPATAPQILRSILDGPQEAPPKQSALFGLREPTRAYASDVGQPLLVARVGSSAQLANRNAGDFQTVAAHLARLEDSDRPQPAGVTGEGPEGLYVHRVVPGEEFGEYQMGNRRQMDAGPIGRAGGAYSFPKGSKYTSSLVAHIPLKELRAELRKQYGTEYFDDLGAKEGGNAIGKILAARGVEEPTRAYANGQQSFDFETRPDTTAAQVDAGRGALYSLLSFRDRNRGSVLAQALTKDFTEQGHTSLIGQPIRNEADLAAAAQVYRDPRFETFRIFYVKDGKIVDHTGLSSRMPASVALFSAPAYRIAGADQALFQMRQRMKDADGYYLLHNHPAGFATPSTADEMITVKLADEVPGFLGHVVIDHNEYATINKRGESRVQKFDFGGYDPAKNPRIPHALLQSTIMSTGDLARVARQLQARSGFTTLINTDSRARIVGIAELPTDSLVDDKGIPRRDAAARLKDMRLRSGGYRTFGVSDDAQKLPSSLFVDAANPAGDTVGSGYDATERPRPRTYLAPEGPSALRALSMKYGVAPP